MMKHWCIFGALCLTLAASSNAQTPAKLVGAPDIILPATEAMQHPEYWIAKLANPDKVVMTAAEIVRFNEKNRTRPLTRKDINGNPVVIDSMTVGGNFGGICFHLSDPIAIKTFPGDRVQSYLAATTDFLAKTTLWDRRQIPFPDQRKNELIEAMNAGAVPPVVIPRYGIVVRHTLNRVVPAHEKVYNGQFQWLDSFQNATIETGTPVAVLHETKNGDWLYVKSTYTFGWVPAVNVALGDAKTIASLTNPADFIIATTHKVPVYGDKNCTVWLTDLYMGEKLAIRKDGDGKYPVATAIRTSDGSVRMVEGWLKDDADVSRGYQAYTQRNVIATFFKLLNRPYGWGGTDHERDCVGAVRDVFATFGIFMPRWTTFELYHTDHVTTLPADMPIEKKYTYLDKCEPGITVCGFNWHVVLYLGMVDGVHYIIHQNGYSYHDAEGVEYRVGRVSVNHTELEGGADIHHWTELSVFKP